MPHVYEYALVRAVPRPERGEFMNVGVLDPALDLDVLDDALRSLCQACDGTGPMAQSTVGQRFRWLTAPRSTILQTSPAHTGLTGDPAAELARLVDTQVRL